MLMSRELQAISASDSALCTIAQSSVARITTTVALCCFLPLLLHSDYLERGS